MEIYNMAGSFGETQIPIYFFICWIHNKQYVLIFSYLTSQ